MSHLFCEVLQLYDGLVASNKETAKQYPDYIMSLPFYSYLPVLAGLIGGLIGGYYYKKNKRQKQQ